MKQVYLAAKFSRREEIERLSHDLPDGWSCCARWVYGGEEGLSLSEIASLDLEDIELAEALIVFTHPRGQSNTNGRMFEAGYAFGLGKQVIFIGPFENVFMNHPDAEVYPSWEEFKAAYE